MTKKTGFFGEWGAHNGVGSLVVFLEQRHWKKKGGGDLVGKVTA